jgi:hypothetical protein
LKLLFWTEPVVQMERNIRLKFDVLKHGIIPAAVHVVALDTLESNTGNSV